MNQKLYVYLSLWFPKCKNSVISDRLLSACQSKRSNLQDTLHGRRRSSTSSGNGSVRFSLKHTKCPACMEKYKIPLPAPKTPNIKVSSVIPLGSNENPILKTNSQNRLSMLINKEMFKLQSYERRFSADRSPRQSRRLSKEMEISSDNLNLSPLELAKIEQEIKEKETRKKLENFLNEEM